MRSLYLRIYLTVLVALALFALVSGWLVQRHFEQERERIVASFQERAAAWGELLQGSLPGADAPPQQQAEALSDWSQRLRLPLALDDAQGVRIGASDSYQRREAEGGPRPRHAQPQRQPLGPRQRAHRSRHNHARLLPRPKAHRKPPRLLRQLRLLR